MAHQVLARKYRPLRFADVVGQDHVTRTLLNALAQNRIAHGYIFSGHRGIGKTTIARILASALNCRNTIGSAARPTPEPCNACDSCLEIRQGSAVDVIEIDAATNRGIDEIRELRDAARYRPSRDKYKIYILDEAHQITDAAFNALLKTLEEPPEHIVFMMATTQPEDIPQTIRSRCQHFSFHAVKLDDIMGQLRSIATVEQVDASDETLALLAEAGDGSMRDALSIMDQAIASAPLQEGNPHLAAEEVRELMGTVSNVVYEQIMEAVHVNRSAEVIEAINRLLDAGNGPQQLARQFVRYLRNCVMAKITSLQPDTEATGLAADLLQISPEERNRAARSAALFTEEELARFLAIMLRTFDELGYRQEQRFHLELGSLKLVHAQRLVPLEDLLSQLGAAANGRPVSSSPGVSGPSLGSAAAPIRPPASAPAVLNTPGTAKTNAGAGAPTAPRPTPLEADLSRRPPGNTAAAAAGAFPFMPDAPSGAAAVSPLRIGAQELSTAQRTEGALALAPEPGPASVQEGPRLVALETVLPAEAHPAPAARDAEPLTLAASAVQDGSDRDGEAGSLEVDLSSLQAAMVDTLAATKGQQSASEQVEEAAFALKNGALEIQTTLSATVLPVVLNADAERILKNVLREQGHGTLKLRFLPGTPETAKPGVRQPRSAPSGSAKELAANHPVVQEAQRLFSAEIRNVVDLRKP